MNSKSCYKVNLNLINIFNVSYSVLREKAGVFVAVIIGLALFCS